MENKELIDIISRDVVVLDPKTPMIDRIGTAARLCYKTDPKEGEDVHAVNTRIIKHCIKQGHESVLEHGAISLFFSNAETPDTKRFSEIFFPTIEGRVDPIVVWNRGATDASDKYSHAFMDPEFYAKWLKRTGIVPPEGEKDKVVPVILADIRAWRTIIEEKFMVCLKTNNPALFVVTLKVLSELYRVSDVLFGDMFELTNNKLKSEKMMDALKGTNIYLQVIKPLEDDKKEISIENIVGYFFPRPDAIAAEEASSCASVTVIFTTDRATTHQLVRHRKDVAYSQESQRYVNYQAKGCRIIPITVDPLKAGDKIKVDPDTGAVDPSDPGYPIWKHVMETCAEGYNKLVELGYPTESARGCLPNDCATKIAVTWLRPNTFLNICYWRLDAHAQYAIRKMMAVAICEMAKMDHPYLDTIPYHLVAQWGVQMKQQKLFSDEKFTDEFIAKYQARMEAMLKWVQENAAKEAKPEKK